MTKHIERSRTRSPCKPVNAAEFPLESQLIFADRFAPDAEETLLPTSPMSSSTSLVTSASTLSDADTLWVGETVPADICGVREDLLGNDLMDGILITEMRLSRQYSNILWASSTWDDAVRRVTARFDLPLQSCAKIYVGQTASPAWRWSGVPKLEGVTVLPHKKSYCNMEVLFMGNGSQVSKLETHLISLFHSSTHEKSNNERRGGDGPVADVMFLYVGWSDLHGHCELTNAYMRWRRNVWKARNLV